MNKYIKRLLPDASNDDLSVFVLALIIFIQVIAYIALGGG